MAGVRESKKEALRRTILQAAKESFLTEGFAETTIADIAAKANIGVGTLYNYFPSKALLFLESYYQDLGNPREKMDEIIRKHGDDPAATIYHITEVYLEPLKKIDRNTLRELFGIFMDSLARNKELADFYTFGDYQYIDFLTKVLEAYQAKGVLTSAFEARDGALSIYSIIAAQSLFFVVDDRLSYETVQDNILRQVRLFFMGKSAREGRKKA